MAIDGSLPTALLPIMMGVLILLIALYERASTE